MSETASDVRLNLFEKLAALGARQLAEKAHRAPLQPLDSNNPFRTPKITTTWCPAGRVHVRIFDTTTTCPMCAHSLIPEDAP